MNTIPETTANKITELINAEILADSQRLSRYLEDMENGHTNVYIVIAKISQTIADYAYALKCINSEKMTKRATETLLQQFAYDLDNAKRWQERIANWQERIANFPCDGDGEAYDTDWQAQIDLYTSLIVALG